MIHMLAGDLMFSTAKVIAQGVASNDPMDQGLALALHKRYPTMHKEFHRWCHQHNAKGGDIWLWRSERGTIIVNLLTQDNWEGHAKHPGKATLPNVNHALHALEKLTKKEGFTSLALPRLSTGVGGLEWTDVRPLIENRLGGLGIPVYVYEDYRPGEKAKEPRD